MTTQPGLVLQDAYARKRLKVQCLGKAGNRISAASLTFVTYFFQQYQIFKTRGFFTQSSLFISLLVILIRKICTEILNNKNPTHFPSVEVLKAISSINSVISGRIVPVGNQHNSAQPQ